MHSHMHAFSLHRSQQNFVKSAKLKLSAFLLVLVTGRKRVWMDGHLQPLQPAIISFLASPLNEPGFVAGLCSVLTVRLRLLVYATLKCNGFLFT